VRTAKGGSSGDERTSDGPRHPETLAVTQVAPRPSRLTARQKRLLQLVFDHFDATAGWPAVARLQHALARQEDQFDVRSAAINLDRSFGLADVQSPNGEGRVRDLLEKL
jgi:hypothetical protein